MFNLSLIELRARFSGLRNKGTDRPLRFLFWGITLALLAFAVPLLWYQAAPLAISTTDAGATPVSAAGIFFKHLVKMNLFAHASRIPEAEQKILNAISQFAANALSLFALVWSSLYIFEKSREVKNSSPFTIIHAFPWEVDHVERFSTAWMLEYYKHADRIYVIAGSYDWLIADTPIAAKMRAKLQGLLDHSKLTLISDRTPSDTFEIWRQEPRSKSDLSFFKKIKFCSNANIKGSFISHNGEDTGFIFLHKPEVSAQRRALSLCYFASKGPAFTINRELKRLIESEMKPHKPAVRAEFQKILNDPWWTS
jgi:hypothetical protein